MHPATAVTGGADDPVELVRRGYDAVSRLYRGDDEPAGPNYGSWLAELTSALPASARVLDVGCGNGIPVARDLVAAGLTVTGVDLSDVQIQRARSLVPGAEFVRGDITRLSWPAASFDAVVALYSIIHVPLDQQRALLGRLADWTRPRGVLLLVTGAKVWTGTEENWLGGDTPMWWSHTDAATYRTWLSDAGWRITGEQFVPEADSGHQLFWARRRAAAGVSPDAPRC